MVGVPVEDSLLGYDRLIGDFTAIHKWQRLKAIFYQNMC